MVKEPSYFLLQKNFQYNWEVYLILARNSNLVFDVLVRMPVILSHWIKLLLLNYFEIKWMLEG